MLGSFFIGFLGTYMTMIFVKKNKINQIVKEAEIEAENLKKEKILQAKEKFLELKTEHEKSIVERERKIIEDERNIQSLSDRTKNILEDIEKKQIEINSLLEINNNAKERLIKKSQELSQIHDKHIKQLEVISGYSEEKAKEELVSLLIDKAKITASEKAKIILDEAELNAKDQAKKIIIETIQRTSAEQAIENTVSVFNLESDDIKGRIIGREGRNIKALEAATGVEIIVDDTPDAIVLSSFDPIRREIARITLQKLVKDGRIHPAKIEEIVEKAEKQLEDEILDTGKKTITDIGIHNINPELIKMIGKMKYRSSYGQNLLQHSREVANLCGNMAAELGLNTKIAKRAGLLHDIGKMIMDSEDPHAISGMKLAEKYGEIPEIVNSIGAHHDEIEMKYSIAPLVQICDSISGARPGARRNAAESYIQRLKDLENIALSFDGVQKVFAIQAGRELRVIVESEKVSDQRASEISFSISEKIQNEMIYPGQVKIIVIREIRSINIAK